MASSFRKLFKSKNASTSSNSTINSREIMSKITTFNQEISRDHLPHINPEPDQDAYPTSPTPSDFRSINVITKKYEIDKQYIREDFYSKENEEKRTSNYIKNQPHLQGRTLTPNPYSALAEYPPLSYSKAVSEKSSKMEAQSSTATPNTTSNTTPNTKPVYYTKPYKQHLMTTPYTKPVNLTELKTFINRVFYEDSPWPTDNITKNQSFYEYILVDSKSIEITHYKDKTNPNLINYSTCKFLRICSTQDLGFIHHHTTKPFSTPGYHIDGYTYTDYKNAFFRAFLLRPYDHSWFFSFDQNCTKTIPGWFNEWWYWYGPADPIYPDQVLKTSYPFYKKHVFDQPVGPLNKIWFHIDMGIPWICSWHFTLAIALQDMPYSLLREFRVKWWEKYNLDRCSLAGIQKYFQITNQAKTAIQTISKSIPLLNPTQISQTNPSPQKRPTSSPTSSTTSSSSQKSSRKEKMKKLIAEMLTQFEAEHDDTDDDNQQVDIMQPEDPYGGPLGQDPVYLYNKTRGKAMQEFRERIQPTMAGPTWDPHEDFCTKQQQFLTAIVGTTQDSTRIKSSVGTTRRRHGTSVKVIFFPPFDSEFPEERIRHVLESDSKDDKGETTILAVHSKDTPTATYTPKQLKWDEITIPDQWKIEITQPPRNFEQKNISKIIEQKDGKILLRFGSYRDPLPPRISSYHSRASFSEYRTGQSSTNSETESVNQNTKQDEPIRFKAPIAEPDQDAYPTSPTPSDFRSINVITKKYEIDKQYIREDFYSKENEEKRTSDYIKNQPHLQGRTLTPNPYSALAEYPPLSYSKAVSEKSSKMEAQSSTATPNTTSNTTPNTKPVYYTKPYKQHLMTTPYTKPVNLTQLKTFINRVFYEDSPWPTDNITKNQSFYEYILVDSKSIEITHYKDKTNPNLINYSTCKFLRICSTQDLGFIHHHTTKPFSTPGYHIDGYTYTDYKNAFFRAFLLRPYDHSWFFSFDQNCTKTIPGWFNEWWYWYGPADPIYPDQVLKTSYPFYKKHVFDQPVGPLNKIWFHIDMGIPWICSWHFTLAIALQDMPYSLLREFRVKWWEKYNLDRCSLAGIQKYFQITNQAKTAIQTISKSIPLLNPTQISQTNPSPQKRPTSSPTSSTTSSSSQKSSRKEKMKKLIAEMLTQFEAEHDDTDDDNQQVDIMQPEDPYGGPLGQDPVYLYNKTRGKAMQEFRERIQPTMAGPTWDPHEDFCTKQQQFLTAIVGTTQDSTRIKSSVGTTRRRHVFQAASPEKAVRPLVNLSCVQLESQSTSEFNPRCLLQDDKGETTILAVHSKDTPTATYTPKQLKWDEITIPDQWKIEITQPPRNFEQKNISKIIEQKDGKILLRFGSYRDPLPPRISSYHSRASFSEYRTGQSSTNSETESVNQNTKQDEPIRFKAPIAEPDQDAYPTSPTPSDFRSINVITKKYEIDKQYIREDFYSKENEEKRSWYFKTFSKQQTNEYREK
ncbi:hypothetical protein IGI04_036679, partial [Brassica rapa subsp. trilocularis]